MAYVDINTFEKDNLWFLNYNLQFQIFAVFR